MGKQKEKIKIEITEKSVQQQKPGKPLVPLTLIIGRWKKELDDRKCKLLIADALNQTVLQKEFEHSIAGYLITSRRVCLVLHLEPLQVRKMLNVFYDQVRHLLDAHWNEYDNQFKKNFWPDHGHHEAGDGKLFIEAPLVNFNLIDLLLGRNIDTIYYDKHKERLKERIRNYPFCSAIDYSGAVSPVIVSKVRKDMTGKEKTEWYSRLTF